MSTRSPTVLPPAPEGSPPHGGDAWYRQPIVWLGSAVFSASIAGCVWLIVVAERNVDPPLPLEGLHVLKMPLMPPSLQKPASSP